MATRAIARLGDLTDHASAPIVTTNQDGTVFCEGEEIAVAGATVQTHFSDPTHPNSPINTNLATKLFVNGKAVVLDGSIADCGAVVSGGAIKTFGT